MTTYRFTGASPNKGCQFDSHGRWPCAPEQQKAKTQETNSSLKSESDEWLTTPEAAAFLKISPKFLLNLASYGRIPFYKFGRSNRYRRSELEKLLRAQPKGLPNGN